MKKLLLIVILILILILGGITITNGMQLAGLSVLGIIEIKEKNENLDIKLQEATKLASTDFKNNQKNLEDAIKQLQSKKEELEEKTNTNTEDYLNGKTATISPYKIDYLWIRIGNHAKTEGVTMKMDTSKNGKEYPGNENETEEKNKVYYYDISFTITGSYINISEFIIDIEDDSSLGFKIEDFNMISSADNGSTVQATFKCKDIPIQGASNNSDISVNTNNGNTTGENNTTNANKTTETNTVNENKTDNTVQ